MVEKNRAAVRSRPTEKRWRSDGHGVFPALFLLALALFSSSARGTDFYVATNGSDANPGTLAAPFLTLAKAQSAEEAAGTRVPRNIFIRGGEYFNVTMLLQGPSAGRGQDDSGCSWIGYPGDPPAILYGGEPLTNWIASSNGWWRAQLPNFPSASLNPAVNELSNWEVRMLLVDGQMAARAQFPVDGSSLTYPNTSSQTDLSYINYREGDLPDTMVATNAEVMIDWSWDSTTLGVSSIIPATRTIRFIGTVWPSRGLQLVPDIQTYRIYNTAEGLSAPGQFYFDRANHIVVYYPIGGKDPNTSEIIVPTTDRLWFIKGYQGGIGLNGVTFSNLTMKVLAADRELEGNFGYLWNHMSLIHLGDNAGPANLTIQNCTLGWCAGNAIGGDFAFPTNAMVRDSEIGFCGGSGVVLRGGANTVVSNNFIHDTGLITWQCPAVRVNTNAMVIQNSIFNCRQSALADHDVDDCQFLCNSISNCMFKNEDMGAYYQYYGTGSMIHPHGNLIQSNLFQRVGTNFNGSGADPRNFYRPAIYLDEQSSNTVIADNIALDCPIPVFFDLATSNAVLNNVFVNTNIVPGYSALRIYVGPGCSPPMLAANNVLYSSTNFMLDNASLWSTWQNNDFWSVTGLDGGLPVGSIVADPLFVSLASGQLGYLAASPCLALGMVALTFTQQAVGVGDAPPAIVPAQVVLSGLIILPGGLPQLSLAGQVGAAYVIQYSADLLSWTGLVTNVLAAPNALFVDSSPPSSGSRFYRIAPP